MKEEFRGQFVLCPHGKITIVVLIPRVCELLNHGLSVQVYASSYPMSLKPMEKVVDYSYNICTTIVPMDYLAMGIIIIVRVVYSWVRLLLMTPLSQKTA